MARRGPLLSSPAYPVQTPATPSTNIVVERLAGAMAEKDEDDSERDDEDEEGEEDEDDEDQPDVPKAREFWRSAR